MTDTRAEDNAVCCESSEGAPACCSSAPTHESRTSSGCVPDCCGPAGGTTDRKKMVVFLLVLGAAGAVLAHALINKSDRTPNVAQAPSATGEGAQGPDVRPPGATPAEAGGPGTETPIAGVPAVASIESLNKVAPDKEAVFILLPGKDRDRARAASKQITSTVKKIQSRGRRVAVFTLDESVSDHSALVKRHAMQSFPCVVAMGKGGASKVIRPDDITEATLLRAFVVASQALSSCGSPGSGASGCGASGCDPTGCE